MPMLKFTFLFNWGSRAGWTETFYYDTGVVSAGAAPFAEKAQQFARERVRILTGEAEILAARVSDVTRPRAVSIVPINLTGNLGKGILRNQFEPDVVNLAQLYIFNSAGEGPRYQLMRGLDDRDVVDGKITYGQNGIAISNRFGNYICDAGWRMQDWIKGAKQKVLTVDGATKTCKLQAPLANLQDGDTVLVKSRTAGQGLKMRWQGRAEHIGLDTFTMKGYHWGDAEGGEAYKLTRDFPDLTTFSRPSPNWSRTRQTGRPFGLPRGRAPKRT